jgi:hypothetical protein
MVLSWSARFFSFSLSGAVTPAIGTNAETILAVSRAFTPFLNSWTSGESGV